MARSSSSARPRISDPTTSLSCPYPSCATPSPSPHPCSLTIITAGQHAINADITANPRVGVQRDVLACGTELRAHHGCTATYGHTPLLCRAILLQGPRRADERHPRMARVALACVFRRLLIARHVPLSLHSGHLHRLLGVQHDRSRVHTDLSGAGGRHAGVAADCAPLRGLLGTFGPLTGRGRGAAKADTHVRAAEQGISV